MGRSTVPSSDPTLIEGAQVSVFDRDGHVEVIVDTDTPEQAEIAITRAKGALVPLAAAGSRWLACGRSRYSMTAASMQVR